MHLFVETQQFSAHLKIDNNNNNNDNNKLENIFYLLNISAIHFYSSWLFILHKIIKSF